ncbi:MAG: HlyD family efflux transporter periplasmic adaptor subunit [Bacteroidetes bacterium]|nr:MAG: HlyD family efflux transporter periplasmic adaptor subunit [Bacteroidota bacterium]
MQNKKKFIWPVLIVVVLTLWFFLRSETAGPEHIRVAVENGDFVVSVYTSGELEAEHSENILGPAGLRTVGLWNVQISELIPEGSIVKEGDWVATLDRTEISNRLKDLETELEKLQTMHTQTRLDTTMELRNARNDLVNLEYGLEEARIALDQSSFEPPAAIRTAEINLDKAQRAFDQASHNYELRLEQAKAKMQEVTASLTQVKRRFDNMNSVLNEFTITAPRSGMVIYRRNWDGSKVTVGSQISTWDNTVATLPDFSVMMSRTYVNEVDISKVSLQQKAEIVVDAFPDKKFTGYVTEVANIGEQRPNQDARVFEVKLRINEADTILRPAMTTKNTIITHVEQEVLFVPIETIHVVDTVSFVYKDLQNRIVRQEVVTGMRNENQIIIKEGLEKGEMIYLSIPGSPEDFRMINL